MAYDQYGNWVPDQMIQPGPTDNPFVRRQRQEQAQQQQQMNPMQAYDMYQQFAGGGAQAGGSTVGGGGLGGAVGGGGGLGGAIGGGGGLGGAIGGGGGIGGAGAIGGGGGAGALGGSGGGMAAAGPWAALAAVIIANENEAKEGGYRSEGTQYYKDLLGGKVLEQDVSKRWSQKLFGKSDKLGLGADMDIGADIATLDFSNAWDKLKKDSSLSKIFDIF